MTEPGDGNEVAEKESPPNGAPDAKDGKDAPQSQPAASEPSSAEKAEPEVKKDPVEEARNDLARCRDQLLRTAADFDNYRKRARRDVEEATRKGAEDLLKTLLPIFDNLERAAVHADSAADVKAIGEGVKMVLKQFVDTLGRAGIKRVAGVGNSFDPMVHEAVQQVETAEAKPGTVIAEVQPGYQYGDRLLRAAMVVVAKAPAKPSGPAEGPAS
jgi:molecular chaperone GrpE